MRRALRMRMEHVPGDRSDLRKRLPGAPRFRGLAFLVFGGIVTIAISLFTLFHLDDHDIVRVTVPGFLFGFGLLVAFVIRNRSDGACSTRM